MRSALVLFAAAAPAAASTIEISPVLIQVTGKPGGGAAVSIRSRSPAPVRLQLRLMRWTQTDRGEALAPAEGAIASPPFLTVRPGGDYVARIARVGGAPLRGEEAYRLLVDELPPPDRPAGSVTLTTRHSIPVFFDAANARSAAVSWRARRTAAGLEIVGANAGERRMRVADLALVGRDGRRATLVPGLLGYVLGGASMRWSLPLAGGPDLAGASLAFTSEDGPVVAPLAADPVLASAGG